MKLKFKQVSGMLVLAILACSENGDSTQNDLVTPATPSENTGNVQIFPQDNPWNTDISNYPVHENSDAYVESMGLNTRVHPDFGTEWEGAPIGIPYAIVDANTPWVHIAFDYSDESDAGPYPIPLNVPIEGGNESDGDRHIILLDTSAMKLYEVWRAFSPGHEENPSQNQWFGGSGAVFDLRSNALRTDGFTSADAAGLPIFPGLVRYDEAVEKGAIRHALRFTAARTQQAYISPATHHAGESTDPSLPPMGLRVRLKKEFDTAGFSPEVRVILQALKNYGMFLADNGSNWYISGSPDSRWNDENLSELSQLRGSDFEAVKTGALRKEE